MAEKWWEEAPLADEQWWADAPVAQSQPRQTDEMGFPTPPQGGVSANPQAVGELKSKLSNLASQAGAGTQEGIAQIAGFPVDAVNSAITGTGMATGMWGPIDKPIGGSASIDSLMKPLRQNIPEPQSGQERMARSVGREFGASSIPAGALSRKAKSLGKFLGLEAASSAGAGVGGQAAEEIAPDNPFARIVGALVGGGAPIAASRARRPSPKTPELADLRARESTAWDKVDRSNVRLPPNARDDLVARTTARAEGDNFDDVLHPRAARARERLEMLEPDPTLSQVNKFRRFVGNNVAGSLDRGEAAVGMGMKSEIDDYLQSIAGGGQLGPNGQGAVDDLLAAREATRRASNVEQVQDLVGKGVRRAGSTGTGGNEINAIRQNLRRVLDDPKKRRSYNEEELKAIEEVVMGTPSVNALRLLGRLSPSSGALPLMGNLAAAGGMGATANPAFLLPGMVGYAAQAGAEGMTNKNVDRIIQLLAEGKPLKGKGVNDTEFRAIISALTSGAAQTTAP